MAQDLSCGDESVASISGTWLLVSSSPNGTQNTAQLVIDGDTFSFTSGSKSLQFSAAGGAMNLTWTDGGRSSPIEVDHTAESLDVGLIPLALGGQWNFASPVASDACIASVAAGAFNAACNRVHSTPFGTLDGSIVGHRLRTSPSLFGQFGGDWHVTSNRGATLDATFENNLFTAKGTGFFSDGTFALKFCKNALAGTSTAGVEITGSRS